MKKLLAVTFLGLSLIVAACSLEDNQNSDEDDFPPTMTETIGVNDQQYGMATGN